MRREIFHDFDAFADSVRGVDSKMMLRNPDKRTWSVEGVDIDTIDVQLGRLGSGNIAQGELRSDGFMLYVPLSNKVQYRVNGDQFKDGGCVVMEPGCDFCFSTKVAHDWAAIFLPLSYAAVNNTGIELSTVRTAKRCLVARPNRRAANRLRAMVEQIIRTASVSSEFESTLAAKSAAAEIFQIAGAFVAAPNSVAHIKDGRPKIPRQEVIDRSFAIIDQRGISSVRVEDLAVAADVSQRTLRTVFNEYYGVGPVRYLQLRRLHTLNRALREADPEETSVTDIMVDHDEWAFSRVAARYRELFGESPSETLKTSK